MKTSRTLFLLLAALLLSGCTLDGAALFPPAEPSKYSAVLLAMDTVMELTVYGGPGRESLDQAEELILRLEGLLSVTDETSEIYTANHSGGRPVVLSEDASSLLEQALRLCDDTGGALDISIYPVVQAWGFTTGEHQIPEEETLSHLLAQVDYTCVSLKDGMLTVPDGMEIDLGAVAKGYTGDRVIELFQQAGVTSACISLGGNVQTLGAKPDGTPWRLAVQDPEGGGYAGIVEVENKAVITSGSYERYFEQDGVRYWHIIDPATGLPARNGLNSVTIVTDSGILGDALSTALFVMGKDRAIDYWRDYGGFDFILIEEDGMVTISEGLADSFSLYGNWKIHTLEVVRT